MIIGMQVTNYVFPQYFDVHMRELGLLHAGARRGVFPVVEREFNLVDGHVWKTIRMQFRHNPKLIPDYNKFAVVTNLV